MLGAYDEGISQSLAAFGAPRRTGEDGPADLWPVSRVGRSSLLRPSTTFTRGWDLAKATGQPTDLDREMASELLQEARMMAPDEFRRPDGVAPFGSIVVTPESASPANQLAAFLGRTS